MEEIAGIPEECQRAGQEMIAEANRVLAIACQKQKARAHNHKRIAALEKELAEIRGNRVYKVLAWIGVLPRKDGR